MTDAAHRRTDSARAVSFDLFGTLVEVNPPRNPARAVGTKLRERGVAVPDDWQRRYETPQIETAHGTEQSLYDHVQAALRDGEREPRRPVVEAAVDDAFEPTVDTVAGAGTLVEKVGNCVPVGVLSNSAVPGLVERAIDRSSLSQSDFDAVIASVDCGVRKPDPRAFEAAATALGVTVDDLLHVGDNPETDGGIDAAGGHFLPVDEASPDVIVARLEGEA